MSTSILVVAGIGAGEGTGAAIARRFAAKGYRIALIARGVEALKKLAADINSSGGSAAPFPVTSYTAKEISSAFQSIKKHWSDGTLRVAIWNVGAPVFKPFLDITGDDLEKITEGRVHGPFAFSKEAISVFRNLDLDERGTRGTLIFTSTTYAIRADATASATAAGNFAQRALSQSLAKAYGKENIHVATAVIAAAIATEGESGDPDKQLQPDAIAETYEFLVSQHRSAYTWELDLRPAHAEW